MALPLADRICPTLRPKSGTATRIRQAGSPAASGDKATYIRSLPTLSASIVRCFWNATIPWLGNAFVQTLEPRLYYLYIPYRDQGMLPNFDSSEMDFNSQLFTETSLPVTIASTTPIR